jgi:hypothetical protein
VLIPGSGLSARKALALIKTLPLDSATVASLQGGEEFRGWDSHMYMLANVIDAINQNTYVLVSANSKRKPKRPEPIPRPAKQKSKKPGGGLFAQMARTAFMNSQAAKKGTTDGGTGRT